MSCAASNVLLLGPTFKQSTFVYAIIVVLSMDALLVVIVPVAIVTCDIRKNWEFCWLAFDAVYDFRLDAESICVSNC